MRGFTLLELLVVLAVILISLALILPNLDTTDNSTFNAQVRRAVAVLNHARRVAIVEGAQQHVNFHVLDPERADYREQLAAVEASTEETRWVSELLRLRFQPDPQAMPQAVEELQLTFYPQGGSTGGVLEFSLDRRTVKVKVDSMTGRITTDLNGEGFDDAP